MTMRRERRTRNIALALLAPNFLGFLIFTAGPVIFSLIMAFTDWNLTLHNAYTHAHIHFIGLDNFRSLLSGEESGYFRQYFGNTLYMMLGIPIGIALSLLGAILLDADLKQAQGKTRFLWMLALAGAAVLLLVLLHAPALAICLTVITAVVLLLGQLFGQTSFRTLYYLPNLTSGVAIFILWKALYNPNNGPINSVLRPALDGLTSAVNHSPAWCWHGLGSLLIVAGAVLALWMLYSTISMLITKEISPLGGLLSWLGVLALALALAGIGYAITELPALAAVKDGIPAPDWLNSPVWSKPALMLMGVFMAIGSGNMLMYLAALSNVPLELREAAAMDGASKWQAFRHVTWPQLAPTTFFIVIMSTIGGLQGGFDAARVMTEGGPAGSTTTLAYYIYQCGFVDFALGLASAISWLMFIVIFVLTIINWKFGNSMVNE